MDQDHLERIKAAREKYKPEKITCLFIAEAPPSDPDRFFYFEEVWEQDSLYLELMKVLFKEDSDSILNFLNDGPSTNELRNNKQKYLKRFREKGCYLIDNLDYPMPSHINNTNDKIKLLDGHKDRLLQKVKSLVDTKTPIVLISIPVFQVNVGTLDYYGYNVIHNEPIPFPGSGQQTKFREKMEKLIFEKKI